MSLGHQEVADNQSSYVSLPAIDRDKERVEQILDLYRNQYMIE